MSPNNNKLRYHFTYKNFAALLDKYEYNFHSGDIVAGTIFGIEHKCILVDIGASNVGLLPLEEASLHRIEDIHKHLRLNEVREFFIILFDQETNQIILSIKKVELMKAWKRIRQVYAENVIIQVLVIKSNRGGYIVQLDGLKGFIPKSHLISTDNKQNLIDQTVLVKILEFTEAQNYLLFCLRCAYIHQNWDIFRVGKIVQGTVYSIQSYGLFVNVERIQGLLHISEISKTLQQALAEIFCPGQDILVMIIHVDSQKGRIAFSQKGIPNLSSSSK